MEYSFKDHALIRVTGGLWLIPMGVRAIRRTPQTGEYAGMTRRQIRLLKKLDRLGAEYVKTIRKFR